MNTITVKFGPGNSEEVSLNEFPTTAAIIGSRGLKQRLGFGDNVEAHVDGSSEVSQLRAGDTVMLVSRANSKG
tara:strand:+ start:113 stop:331 length:219 start_codon:yes stop_codon:yes gene_type:complete